ncbi:MAG: hypothetical protein ACI9T7_002672 [Oleiphilaceae bacterium]|jgi:hypothetical protein
MYSYPVEAVNLYIVMIFYSHNIQFYELIRLGG